MMPEVNIIQAASLTFMPLICLLLPSSILLAYLCDGQPFLFKTRSKKNKGRPSTPATVEADCGFRNRSVLLLYVGLESSMVDIQYTGIQPTIWSNVNLHLFCVLTQHFTFRFIPRSMS